VILVFAHGTFGRARKKRIQPLIALIFADEEECGPTERGLNLAAGGRPLPAAPWTRHSTPVECRVTEEGRGRRRRKVKVGDWMFL